MKELSKTYDPREVEGKIYQMWLDRGCFHAVADPEKKPFAIVMPPPNVTGQLHMGHALDATLQDILTRFKRMQGYSALWLPGTDHAGIATQIKVEEDPPQRRGADPLRPGPGKIPGARLGLERKIRPAASCTSRRSWAPPATGTASASPWTRAAPRPCGRPSCALYEKGLIYKGSRIINWCPHCITALSDAEVEYVDKPGNLWHLRYPLSDGSGDLIVATTRPETMMGDTAVAVNPNDERYQHLVGKTCILPLMNREIPIIADDYCEMDFGTGCVKMTPAHDPNDFEIGLRHNLETIRVIDDHGKINENGGRYQGLDRYECRKAVLV